MNFASKYTAGSVLYAWRLQMLFVSVLQHLKNVILKQFAKVVVESFHQCLQFYSLIFQYSKESCYVSKLYVRANIS